MTDAVKETTENLKRLLSYDLNHELVTVSGYDGRSYFCRIIDMNTCPFPESELAFAHGKGPGYAKLRAVKKLERIYEDLYGRKNDLTQHEKNMLDYLDALLVRNVREEDLCSV